MKDELSTKEE
jgi:uncharacterized coiled-coil protein SlyX